MRTGLPVPCVSSENREREKQKCEEQGRQGGKARELFGGATPRFKGAAIASVIPRIDRSRGLSRRLIRS